MGLLLSCISLLAWPTVQNEYLKRVKMFDVISFICNPLPLKKNTNTSEIQNSAYIEKKK